MWWGRRWLISRGECRSEASPMSSRDTAAVGLTSLPEFRGPHQLNAPRKARTCSRDPRGWTTLTTCVIPPRVDHVGGVDDLGLPVSRRLVAGGGPSGCQRLARWRGRRPPATSRL